MIIKTFEYAYTSKKDIVRALTGADGDKALVEFATIMDGRQTDHERAVSFTIDKNRRGWMSSHSVKAPRILKALQANEEVSPEDLNWLTAAVMGYRKQLAEHFRTVETETSCELVKARFDVGPLPEKYSK